MLGRLQEEQERGLDDFELNRELRRKVRALKEEEEDYRISKLERNMADGVALLPPTKEDEQLATLIDFKKKKIKK